MNAMVKIAACFCALALLVQCRKEASEVSIDRVLYTSLPGRVNDLFVVSATECLAVGGIRREKGGVARTTDGGATWQSRSNEFASASYSLFCNAFGECRMGGDDLRLWRSTDYGATWNYEWLADNVPMHEEDRPIVRAFLYTADRTWFFVGGENYGEGIVYRKRLQQPTWNWKFYRNELRAIHGSDSLHAFAAGHGAWLHTAAGWNAWQRADWEGDFITASAPLSTKTSLACSALGSIFLIDEEAPSLREVFQSKSGAVFTDIAVAGARVVAAGSDGTIVISNDAGSNWKCFRVEEKPALYCAAIVQDEVWLGSESGEILVIDWNKLR